MTTSREPYKPGGILGAVQRMEFPRKLGLCELFFARMLSRRGICWVDTAAGLPWKLDLTNATHRWIVYGKYEQPAFLDWARAHLPRDGVVVDSGANIGQMLLYLAQWVPAGLVLAFEPGDEAANWLAECLYRNPHLPVELVRCGLGAGEAKMTLRPIGERNLHGARNQAEIDGPGQKFQARALKDVLRERGVDHVDLWKLDMEGFELQALAGAEALLSERKIRAVYAELGFGNGERIRAYLGQRGYDCFLFDRGGTLIVPGKFPDHTNALFLPR